MAETPIPPTTPSTTAVSSRPPHTYKFRGEGTGPLQNLSWIGGRFVSRIISMLLFRLRVSGQTRIPKTGGVLMITNHQSFLDPWLLGIAPSRQLHYMARDSLFKGGFLTWLMELWNVFPVKRGSADLGAIRTAVERLDSGFLVNIFPEGTRSEDGSLGTIAGGFSLILNRTKTDVALLPTLIEGAYEAWPRNAKFPRIFTTNAIRIRHGTPIPAAAWRELSPEDLALRIRREWIQLQVEIGSAHAGASQARLDADLAITAARPPKVRRRAGGAERGAE
jgi:1-acyl-sn-glycerol-3-phosphate acyltransferase